MGGPGSGRKKGGTNKSRLAAAKKEKAVYVAKVKAGGKATSYEKNRFGKVNKVKVPKSEYLRTGKKYRYE